MDQDVCEVVRAETRLQYARCIQIRTRVFVLEQKVPPERELDSHEDACLHYLALVNGTPVGTARWRPYDEDTAKIERMAVLVEARGMGVGTRLMAQMMTEIAARPELTWVRLAAQSHAIPFYEAMGFGAVGDAYEDGGLPHRDMVLNVRARQEG